MIPQQTIPGRFEAIVKRQPDHIAISSPDCEWTYRELGSLVDRIAASIQKLPGKRDAPVALLLPHGPPLIAAIMGTLKAGRIYLVLDPADPPVRLRAVLEHSGADSLLVDETTANLAEQIATPALQLLKWNDAVAARSMEAYYPVIDPDSGAWLMYTSGSTGEPKGVWQTHAGVVHLADVYAQLIGINSDDRLSLLTSCGLAASASAIFGALLNCATLCPFHLRSQGVERMLFWVKARRVTILHAVPTVFRQAIRANGSEEKIASLRWVRLGGEPVTRADVELFAKHCPTNCRLLHAYSSTETGLVCAQVIDHDPRFDGWSIPVGKPVVGATISLIGENGRAVASGEPGRIVVSSAGVSAGYWRGSAQSDVGFQTAKNGNTQRTFVTSDLGRILADGTIEHLGRTDHQVKIRGQRVDLAAVDAAIRMLPDVTEVATVANQDSNGNGRLVAFVANKDQSRVDGPKIRRELRKMVPAALVPDEIRFLEKLPQTAGGKVDRKALANCKLVERSNHRTDLPARDWFEKGLATIWQNALGLSVISRTDDFFELGGSSIELAQIISRIDDEFGVTLSQSIFIEYPTIEQLGIVLAGRIVQMGSSALVRITSTGQLPPLVLVHGGKGDVAMFGQLARRISDRPVFAFQSVGLNGENWPLISIQAMADRYLKDLKAAIPNNEFVLAGACMGGLIALEMACQSWRSDVGRINHVFLIDSELPIKSHGRSSMHDRLIENVRDTFRFLRWRIFHFAGRSMTRDSLPAYRRFVHAMNSRARRGYCARRFDGSITILCAAEGGRNGSDPRLALREFARHSKVVEVGGHRSQLFLPPAVDDLADRLNALMPDQSPVRYPS